jgi:hypothetical protein
MSSLAQLSEGAVNLTAEVNHTAMAPPAVAQANPLLELLLAEVRRHLPDGLQHKLAAAAEPGAFLDWFGVALLWRAMPREIDRKPLLSQMGTDPSQAAMAWAHVVAPHVPPAPPTQRQKTADSIGLTLQFGLVALLLAMRCGAVYLLGTAPAPASPAWWAGALVYHPLLALPGRAWRLLLPIGLCVVELFAPRWMARLRRWASAVEGVAPLSQVRADAFPIAWRMQVVLLGAACVWRLVAG